MQNKPKIVSKRSSELPLKGRISPSALGLTYADYSSTGTAIIAKAYKSFPML
jgi:hypothetical protein